MKISDEVYNCLLNQAIVLKHESDECESEIARKVVEEYFRGNELEAADKKEIASRIGRILGD